MTRSDRVGVVLAGGRSRRFADGDKVLATVDGEPLVRRVVRRVGSVTDGVLVSCRRDQRESLVTALDGCAVPVAVVVDPVDDRGPLAGVHAALRSTHATDAAVVAADLPFASPAVLEALFEACAGRGAAVSLDPDGSPVPTHAVYRVPVTRRRAARSLRAGTGRLMSLVEGEDVQRVAHDAAAALTTDPWWHDVDTVDALAVARRLAGPA